MTVVVTAEQCVGGDSAGGEFIIEIEVRDFPLTIQSYF
jgi:hypothetical protein